MPGQDDLSQVMTGIDYAGVNINSYGFGNEQGFGSGGYGALPWDTYDALLQDITIILDGSTINLELESPLENGIVYNVYLSRAGSDKFVRIDDENYGTSEPVNNVNAVMPSIIGDGSTTTVLLDPVLVPTGPGDVIVIRKITSDGSFAPTSSSYDTVYDGGNTAYTTAVGIAASDIIVDGDGLVTHTTSAGPEELVPGQMFDTLDIRVYNRPSDGCGIVNVDDHVMKNNVFTYPIPGQPIKKEAIIVKINNRILRDTEYSIDYTQNIIDVTTSYVDDGRLTIMTVESNGEGLVEKIRIIFDGVKYTTELPVKFNSNITVITSVNGTILKTGTEFIVSGSSSGNVEVTISPTMLSTGDVIDFMVFEDYQQTLSQVYIDKTFVADGNNKIHKFDGTTNPIPYSRLPISHKVLVKVDDTILKSGYTKKYVAGNSLEYAMYHVLAKDFDGNKRVKFLITTSYLSFVTVGGYTIRFHHGHAIKYGGGIGGIFIPAFKAISQWQKSRSADLDVFGHFHASKDGGNFLCNGSLIGYNEYAVSIKCDYEKPKQTFFLVDHKRREKTITTPIFLE
jgi:hypothetical protein